MTIREPVVPGRPLTQGSILGVDQAVARTLGAYRQAEDEIREALIAYANANLDPTIGQAARAQQRAAILTRVGDLRVDLLGEDAIYATDTLARVYNDGAYRTERALAIGGVSPAGSASFALIHRDAVDMLAADAFDDLASATGYMEAQAKRQIREATKLRTLSATLTGDAVGTSTRRLVDDLERRGVDAFVDRAGHRWRLSTYAEMVVRTKSAHAHSVGTALRCEETGTTAMVIRDGDRSGHRDCVAYNGLTCSTGWAVDHPIEHPNCVRAFLPAPLHRGPVDLDGDDVATPPAEPRPEPPPPAFVEEARLPVRTVDEERPPTRTVDEQRPAPFTAPRRQPVAPRRLPSPDPAAPEPRAAAKVTEEANARRRNPPKRAADLTLDQGREIASLAMARSRGDLTGRAYRQAVREITGT